MSNPVGVFYNGEKATDPNLSSTVLSAGGDDSHVIDFVYSRGGDSAISMFFDAVKELNNNHNENSGVIRQAGDRFRWVSESLASVNSRLSASWAETASLCYKLDEKVQQIIATLIVEMNRYAELVNAGELEEVQAVNETNTVTNSLLDELNGI